MLFLAIFIMMLQVFIMVYGLRASPLWLLAEAGIIISLSYYITISHPIWLILASEASVYLLALALGLTWYHTSLRKD